MKSNSRSDAMAMRGSLVGQVAVAACAGILAVGLAMPAYALDKIRVELDCPAVA